MLNISVKIAQEAWDRAFDSVKPSESFERRKNAVIGYLSYIANYLMADSLSLTSFVGTNSTAKNLFAFLPRATLHQSFQALPEEVRVEKDDWMRLLDPIMDAAKPFGSLYWQNYEWLKPRSGEETTAVFYEGESLEENEESQEGVKDVDARENTRKILEKLFQGEDPQEPFKRPLPELDMPHKEIYEKTGQKGIALEDRYFQEKQPTSMTVASFGKAMITTFQESQERLLSHVPEFKEQIALEASQTPDPSKAVSERIKEMRKRIEEWPQNLENGLKQLVEEIQEFIKMYTEDYENAKLKVEKLEAEKLKKNDKEISEAKDDMEDALTNIEQQNKKMIELEQTVAIVRSKASEKEPSLQGEELLEALHAREIEIQHIFSRFRHTAQDPERSGEYFKKATFEVLNEPEIKVARQMKEDIKPEDLEGETRMQVENLLKSATEQHNVFRAKVSSLSQGQVAPKQASLQLMEIRTYRNEFINLVSQANDIYMEAKQK